MRRGHWIAVAAALVLGGVGAAVLVQGGESGPGLAGTGTQPEPGRSGQDRSTPDGRRSTNQTRGRGERRPAQERPFPPRRPRGLVVGVGDQKPEVFDDALFTEELHVRRSRLVTPWNSTETEPERLGAWLAAARREGVEPVVAFERARGNQCPAEPCTLPSVAEYEAAFRAFRQRYPWVRIVQPWNEANNGTQPTGKAPAQAAAFYKVVRRLCRGCLVPAADVLDSANMERWVRRFLAASGGSPRLWGLHNYSDTNRFRDRGTQRLLQLVRGDVWITESGGIYSFTDRRGRAVFPADERRAARATDYMFRLALKHRSRVKRVYVYQWRVDPQGTRFDAGLVSPEGKPRAALKVVRRYLNLFR